MDAGQYIQDALVQAAVERKFEIIGEDSPSDGGKNSRVAADRRLQKSIDPWLCNGERFNGLVSDSNLFATLAEHSKSPAG
jgi:hypothetical protein